MIKARGAGLAALLALSVAVAPAFAEPTDSEQMAQYLDEMYATSVSQVNSVSELSDVDPNSWAFQALKTVVERYGCLEGYPNKTYLGNKPLTRYEFAAGLNACLERVNELITANTANKATKEDLATLQRLQDEFRTELAALRGRVDALEAKTRDIESKLFSTTSKLDGSVVMAVTGGGGQAGGLVFNPIGATGPWGDSPFIRSGLGLAGVPATAANTSFVARTTLNLRATITGNDELLVRLRGVTGQDLGAIFPSQASNFGTLFYALGPGNVPYDGSFPGVGSTPVAAAGFSQGTNGASQVVIDKIRYLYNFSENFNVYVGPRIDIYEFFDVNSFNNEETTFSSGFTINSPAVAFFFTGPGGGFNWNLTDWVSIRALYFALAGGSAGAFPGGEAFGGSGIFGGSNVIAGEVEFNPSNTSHIKFTYVRLYEQGTLYGAGLAPLVAAAFPTAPAGSVSPTASTDIFGFNAEWAIVPQFILFGRYTFSNSNLSNLPGGIFSNQISANVWQGGFGLPNLFGTGNLFGAVYGQPVRFNGGSIGQTGVGNLSTASIGTENVIEVFYRFQVSDRLSITPDVQWVINAANTRDSVGLTVGTLRLTFNF
jgi:hypothetical protein